MEIGFGETRLLWKVDGLSVSSDLKTEEPALPPDGSIDAIFVEAIRSGDRSAIRSDYAEGMRTLALCLGANDSARTGSPVQL